MAHVEIYRIFQTYGNYDELMKSSKTSLTGGVPLLEESQLMNNQYYWDGDFFRSKRLPLSGNVFIYFGSEFGCNKHNIIAISNFVNEKDPVIQRMITKNFDILQDYKPKDYSWSRGRKMRYPKYRKVKNYMNSKKQNDHLKEIKNHCKKDLTHKIKGRLLYELDIWTDLECKPRSNKPGWKQQKWKHQWGNPKKISKQPIEKVINRVLEVSFEDSIKWATSNTTKIIDDFFSQKFIDKNYYNDYYNDN